VRAEVIAALLLEPHGADGRGVPAVRIAGARICGELNLADGRVLHPLMLRACRFDHPIVLDNAVTRSVDLRESRFPRLHADGIRVSGNLDLRDAVAGATPDAGSEEAAVSGIRAVGARIDGDLYAGGITVSGGCVLVGAEIGGVLTLRYAHLRNAGGTALEAGGLRLGRGLLLSHLQADGAVRLPGARIGAMLRLDNAHLSNPGGQALSAEALTVDSDIFAQHLTADGCLYLPSAQIGGGFRLDGATLSAAGSTGAVIFADRAAINRDLALRDEFTTDGDMRFSGTQIGGQLDITGMQASASLLDLSGAHAGNIRDTYEAWPARVNLDGFTYSALNQKITVQQRLEILGRQSGDQPHDYYRPHPYEQLAAHYRALGNDDDARTVLLTKQRHRRRTLPLAPRIAGYILDAAVGYGYRPLRAVMWVTVLLIAGSVYFSRVHPTPSGPGSAPPYNAILFAADQLIPVVKFGQQDAWQVHGIAQYVAVALTACGWTLGIAIAAAVTRALARN
jgi:hypothetical protein